MDKDKTAPEFQVSDRRFWVRDEALLDAAQEPKKRYPTYVEELKARTELAEKKLQDRLEELDRENEAFRARFRKAAARRAEQQQMEMLRGLLEVIDNLERALRAASADPDPHALKEGVDLSLRLFLSKLEAEGIEPIPLHGKTFDPRVAEAVGAEAVEDPALDQTVREVVEQGYQWRDQLLRPARVVVGQYTPEA